IKNRATGPQNLSHHTLKLTRKRRSNLSCCLADVRLRWKSVALGKSPIDSDISEVGTEHAKADGRLIVDGLELRYLACRTGLGLPELLLRLQCLLNVGQGSDPLLDLPVIPDDRDAAALKCAVGCVLLRPHPSPGA